MISDHGSTWSSPVRLSAMCFAAMIFIAAPAPFVCRSSWASDAMAGLDRETERSGNFIDADEFYKEQPGAGKPGVRKGLTFSQRLSVLRGIVKCRIESLKGIPTAPAVRVKEDSGSDYLSIPYDCATFKASHNSYDREEAIRDHLEWNPEDRHQAGCRGVEFDLRQDSEATSAGAVWRWCVKHDGTYDMEHPGLRDYLGQLRRWADEHPGHDPVTVHLELKDAFGDDGIFASKLDEAILDELCGGDRERLFTPGGIMDRGGGEDLLESARSAGWPTIGELRGRFIVVLTGGDGGAPGRRRAAYAAREPRDSLAFVDMSLGHIPAAPPKLDGRRIFLNVEVQSKFLRDKIMHRGDRDKWKILVKWAAGQRGIITRGWKVNDGGLWRECLALGLNIPATDKVRNHAWATVGGAPFVRIPGK